jgi:hypothetical protein
MNLMPENGIGDLLIACKRLKTEDDAIRSAIAKLIGYDWCTPDMLPIKPHPKQKVRREPLAHEARPPYEPKTEPIEFDVPEFPRDPKTQPVLAELPRSETTREEQVLPDWLADTRPLPLSSETTQPEAQPKEALMAPLRTRALLTDALATGESDGPVDIGALQERICRVEPITEFPRLARRTLSHGVDVLIDRAIALTPFYDDQLQLVERIRALVGDNETRVSFFAGNPLVGVGTGDKTTWKPWQPPRPARPILILTDLGILDIDDLEEDELEEVLPDWSSFARLANRCGCPVLAMVPYPRKRWPEEMIGLFPILMWDRNLLLKDLRQAMGQRWIVTG